MPEVSKNSLTVLLERLRRADHLVNEAQKRKRAARAALVAEGYSSAAIRMALDMMRQEPGKLFDTMVQAKALLAAHRSPVQIELIGHIETPAHADPEHSKGRAFDDGYSARILGEPDDPPFKNTTLKEAWSRGWAAAADEVD